MVETYLCSDLARLDRSDPDGCGPKTKQEACNDSGKTHGVRIMMRRCLAEGMEGSRIYTIRDAA